MIVADFFLFFFLVFLCSFLFCFYAWMHSFSILFFSSSFGISFSFFLQLVLVVEDFGSNKGERGGTSSTLVKFSRGAIISDCVSNEDYPSNVDGVLSWSFLIWLHFSLVFIFPV